MYPGHQQVSQIISLPVKPQEGLTTAFLPLAFLGRRVRVQVPPQAVGHPIQTGVSVPLPAIAFLHIPKQAIDDLQRINSIRLGVE